MRRRVDGVQVDGIAGLEIGSKVDRVGRSDVHASLVGELVVALLDQCELRSCSQAVLREAFTVDTEAGLLAVGTGKGRVRHSTAVVHAHDIRECLTGHVERPKGIKAKGSGDSVCLKNPVGYPQVGACPERKDKNSCNLLSSTSITRETGF